MTLSTEEAEAIYARCEAANNGASAREAVYASLARMLASAHAMIEAEAQMEAGTERSKWKGVAYKEMLSILEIEEYSWSE